MRYAEKLWQKLVRTGFTQQRLAKLSGVSDSEVSRILNNRSQPGLENAFKLAKALGVSLDYLADDELDADPFENAPGHSPPEREVLDLMKQIEPRHARRILEITLDLGVDVAIRRLLGVEAKPIIELDDRRPAVPDSQREPAVGRSQTA